MRSTLVLTPGDPVGIGPEILIKALRRLDEFPDVQFIVVGSYRALEKAAAGLMVALPQDARVRYQPVEADLPGAAAFKALDVAVRMMSVGEAHTLVTGPISKQNLQKAGILFPGHTEILESLAARYYGRKEEKEDAGNVIPIPPLNSSKAGAPEPSSRVDSDTQSAFPGLPPLPDTVPRGKGEGRAEMLFLYKGFRLLLLTRHVKLKDVPETLAKPGAVARPIKTLIHFLRHQLKIEEPKIALLGVNPHAGELGGDEENQFYAPVMRAVNAIGASRLEGPFAADGFFRAFDPERPGYDAVVAAYHDQGLIPFKLLAGYEAVNVTIGLPFLRTSVSHGTAPDIAGKGVAREDSLMAAIRVAQEF